MAERFLDGGRLLAFGSGPYATDAQHVAVEFVHPVIVGKRALPALDLSMAPGSIPVLARPEDVVIGFGPPEGDKAVDALLAAAHARGALTFALPGTAGDYAIASPSSDPFIHQEMIEILYHTLWETVHVFIEHREQGGEDVGESSFLYPFLGGARQDTTAIVDEVAASIVAKAQDDERLRLSIARESSAKIAGLVHAMRERIDRGGRLIVFGNGGSATDANDFVLDCVMPPEGWRPVPAISLSAEPAVISAVANDIGAEAVFLRQLIAHASPEDVVIAISTSGNSAGVVAALAEARRRGMMTAGLLGYDGGEIVRRGLVDHAVVIASDYIPRIQEVQATVYHVLRQALEELS